VRKTRELLISPYQLIRHLHAFPEEGAGRVLYRIDENQRLGNNLAFRSIGKEPELQRAEYLTLCLLIKSNFTILLPT